MDAALMDGSGDLRCGAVAGLRATRHPIQAARHVLESSEHVFFGGDGAERMAIAGGVEQAPEHWFATGLRREQLHRELAEVPWTSIEMAVFPVETHHHCRSVLPGASNLWRFVYVFDSAGLRFRAKSSSSSSSSRGGSLERHGRSCRPGFERRPRSGHINRR